MAWHPAHNTYLGDNHPAREKRSSAVLFLLFLLLRQRHQHLLRHHPSRQSFPLPLPPPPEGRGLEVLRPGASLGGGCLAPQDGSPAATTVVTAGDTSGGLSSVKKGAASSCVYMKGVRGREGKDGKG